MVGILRRVCCRDKPEQRHRSDAYLNLGETRDTEVAQYAVQVVQTLWIKGTADMLKLSEPDLTVVIERVRKHQVHLLSRGSHGQRGPLAKSTSSTSKSRGRRPHSGSKKITRRSSSCCLILDCSDSLPELTNLSFLPFIS